MNSNVNKYYIRGTKVSYFWREETQKLASKVELLGEYITNKTTRVKMLGTRVFYEEVKNMNKHFF